MSDLPPDQTVAQGPAGSAGSPAETPPWALPAAPPPPPSSQSPADLAAPATWAAAPLPATAATPAAGVGPAMGLGPATGARVVMANRQRWLPTIAVASIIAAVVLGGVGLDNVIAAPSAGLVTVGGSVTMDAAPGWILASPPGDTASGIELEKATAILTAQVVSSSYGGDSVSMLSDQERSLSGDSAQISYGGARRASISGHDTAYVAFEAAVSSGRQRAGIVDGELVCMVVNGNAVVIVVAAPQGDLDPVIDDVSAMLKSVRVGQ